MHENDHKCCYTQAVDSMHTTCMQCKLSVTFGGYGLCLWVTNQTNKDAIP